MNLPTKINRPNIARMKNARYVQLMTECKDVFMRIGIKELKIWNFFETVFMVLLAKLLEAFNHTRKSALTQLLNDADFVRDEAYSSLCDIIKSYMRSPKENFNQAANRIYILLTDDGNLARKPLDEQTAFTEDLIDKLETVNAEDVALLRIEHCVEDLKTANKNFDAVMKKRYNETENKSDITVIEIRKEMDEVFRTFCHMLETFSITESDETYNRCIKSLNTIFARYGSKRSHTPSNGGEGSDGRPQNPSNDGEDKYPNAREWSSDIDYQTCASGDIFYIVRNGVKEYYKLLDFGEVATFEPGMDDGGIWEKLS